MVLPCCRTHRTHLYDRSRDDQHLERALVVRSCMSSRQYVRPSFIEILTPQANTGIRAHVRLPPVHGVLYLQHVRHPTDINRSLERGRIDNVEWYRSRVLDDYRDDYHRRCYAEFHLCATHMVLVLSHGYHLPLGGSEEGATAQGLYEHSRIKCLSDEVQELRPSLSDATHTLRQPRTGDWLSRSRLSEMRQMHAGLSFEDYDIKKLKRLWRISKIISSTSEGTTIQASRQLSSISMLHGAALVRRSPLC